MKLRNARYANFQSAVFTGFLLNFRALSAAPLMLLEHGLLSIT